MRPTAACDVRDWEKEHYSPDPELDYFYDEVPYWEGKELGWAAQV